jgi:DNA-binding beta-propeller fold protein YncE
LDRTDPGPVQVMVTPDQKFAYIANDGRGSVQKIDLVSNHIVMTIQSLPTREATAWPSGQEAS